MPHNSEGCQKIYRKDEHFRWYRTVKEQSITDPGAVGDDPSPGDLRVHVHSTGTQVWILKAPIASTPAQLQWIPAKAGDRHPGLEGYVLSFKKSKAYVPGWVLNNSHKAYHNQSKKTAPVEKKESPERRTRSR